jgi:hypothetical protein
LSGAHRPGLGPLRMARGGQGGRTAGPGRPPATTEWPTRRWISGGLAEPHRECRPSPPVTAMGRRRDSLVAATRSAPQGWPEAAATLVASRRGLARPLVARRVPEGLLEALPGPLALSARGRPPWRRHSPSRRQSSALGSWREPAAPWRWAQQPAGPAPARRAAARTAQALALLPARWGPPAPAARQG